MGAQQSEKADPGRRASMAAEQPHDEPPEHFVDQQEADAEIQRIASHMTAQSQSNATLFPFQPEGELDPNSAKFNPRSWAKAYYNARNDALEGASLRRAGFAFKHLNVYGFGSSIDFQKDVTHIFLEAYNLASRALGQSKPQRVDILRDFEGK